MLINLRNALMAGKRLPYDAEVEYLESSGTQYIDLGFSLTPSSDLYATVMLRGTVTNAVIFGQSNKLAWGANNPAYAIANSSAGKIFFTYGPTNNLYTSDIGVGTLTDISYVGTTYTINGTTTTIPRVSSWSAVQGNAHVFCRRHADGSISPISKARVYSIKFVDNGATTHHFIPVRKGTVGYLYDRVSGKLFGNAGTGDFQYGQDVVPVEYLQSRGTQYIDTGVVGYKTTKVESHCALLNANSAYPAMWGARTGSRNNDFQIYYNTPTIGGNPSSIVLRTGNSDKSIYTSDIGVNTFIGTRLDIVAADGALSVNGYNFSTPAFSNFTTPHSILMFCEYTANTPVNFGSFVYWGMKMWQADSIVRSFLPVRVGTEGAMMDVLTRRIYRNAGTGAFTYGNDLKYPIPAS